MLCTFTSGLDGYWSTEGCELKEVKESASNLYVTCECSQLTTFAVLMNVGEVSFPNLAYRFA